MNFSFAAEKVTSVTLIRRKYIVLALMQQGRLQEKEWSLIVFGIVPISKINSGLM